MRIIFQHCSGSISKKNLIESNVGLLSFQDYPALSIVSDNTPSYTTSVYGFTLGRRFDESLMLGIQWGFSTLSTSYVDMNESVLHNTFSLLIRHYEHIGEKFELCGGLLFGLSLMNNGLDYQDNHYSFTRTGMIAEFSIGANYNLTPNTYIGLLAGMNVPSVNFSKDIKLPSSLKASEKKTFNGYHISFTYGIRL